MQLISIRRRVASLMLPAITFCTTLVAFKVTFWMETEPETSVPANDYDTALPTDSLGLNRSLAASLRDVPVLIMVADISVNSQVQAIKDNIALTPQKPLRVVVVSNGTEQLRQALSRSEQVLYTPDSEFPRLLRRFRMHSGSPSWLLYDRSGTLRARALFDSDSLPYFLRTVVDGQSQYTGALLASAVTPEINRYVSTLSDKVSRSTRSGVAVLLIESARSACGEGDLLAELKTRVSTLNLPLVVVPLGTMTALQADVLVTNHDLMGAIVAPPPDSVKTWWSSLKQRYGVGVVNGSVLFYGRTGSMSAATNPDEIKRIARI